MEEKNIVQIMGPGTSYNLVSPNSLVRIPLSRYDELIRAERERDVLLHAYESMDSFGLMHVMDAVFDPIFNFDGGSGVKAPNPKEQ